MKQTLKRIGSLLLVACMAVTLLPCEALAVGADHISVVAGSFSNLKVPASNASAVQNSLKVQVQDSDNTAMNEAVQFYWTPANCSDHQSITDVQPVSLQGVEGVVVQRAQDSLTTVILLTVSPSAKNSATTTQPITGTLRVVQYGKAFDDAIYADIPINISRDTPKLGTFKLYDGTNEVNIGAVPRPLMNQEKTYTAKICDQYGGDITIDTTKSITGTGFTYDAGSSTYQLKLTSATTKGNHALSYDGQSIGAYNVTMANSVLKAVALYRGAELIGETDTLFVHEEGGQSNTYTYSAKGFDQYGDERPEVTLEYSVTGTAPTGVDISTFKTDHSIKVSKDAVGGPTGLTIAAEYTYFHFKATTAISLSGNTSNSAPTRKSGVAETATAGVTVNNPYTLDLSTIFEDKDIGDSLTYTVSVNGSAEQPAAASYSYTPTTTGSVTLVFKANDGKSDSTTYTVTLTVNEAPTYGISLSQSSAYTFTPQTAGYSAVSPLSVTASNTGNQATGALTLALSGTNSGSFTLSKPTVSSIAKNGTDSFTVAPNNDLTAGTYTATVTVSGGNGITKSFDVSFTVNEAPTYGISLSQSSAYTFTPQTAGYSAVSPLSVTASNTGNQATGALTLALSGTNSGSFTLSKPTVSSIAKNGNDSFTVAPNNDLSAGIYTATVTVSGGNGITKSFDVSFTVNEAPTYGISLSQSSAYTFTPQTAGYSAVSPLSVTASNTGNQATGALTLALSGTNSGSFTLSKPTASSIAKNGTDSFTVAPNNDLSAGIYTATVTVSGGNGITKSFDVSFTVNEAPTYGISLSQSSAYTFTPQTAGYSAVSPLSVTASNTGNQATGALTLALSGTNSGSFTLSKPTVSSIAKNGTDSFTVAPNNDLTAGIYTATVTVSGGNGITKSFDVSFTVNEAPTYGISLSQSSAYTFTPQTAGYSAVNPLSVTASNTGNQATGALALALSGTNSGSFTLSKPTISSIAKNGTDSFTVAPNNDLTAGIYTATVTVSGGNGITKSFDVSFTVNEAPTYGISLSQSSAYTFTPQTAGYSAVSPLSVTASNTGNQATGALTLALSGTNSGSFTLSKPTVSSIAKNGTDSFTVAPNVGLTAGTYTATVTVSGGNGITKSFDVSFTVNEAPTYGISLSQSSAYTFTPQTAGYSAVSPLSVTASNTGNQATGALTLALSGTNSGSFTLSKPTVSSIAKNGTDSFTVAPNNDLTAGIYTATVTVSGGNGITKSFDVSFTVNEAPTYGISLSQSSAYTFTPQTAGYSAVSPLSVTASNTGNQATGALTLALSGTNSGSFTLSKPTVSSIAKNGTDSFTVAPNVGLTAGTYTATVTVSGGNGITKSFDVSFTVNEAPTYGISLSQSSAYTFTPQTAGYSAVSPLSVTASNTGNQATGALTLALSGTNSGSFTLSKPTVSSIAKNGTDSFTVAPNVGLTAGTYTATVTVSGGNSILKSFTVSFTVNSSGGSNGGGSFGGGSSSGNASYQATATGKDGSSVTLNVTTSGTTAEVTVGTAQNSLVTSGGRLAITMPTVKGTTSYGVKLPASDLSADAGGALTMNTELGSISLPSNMLSSLPGTTDKTAQITISNGDSASLSDNVKTAIGDRPIIQLSLSLGGTQSEWSNPNAQVTVGIPYTPTAAELQNPDRITVWYIDGSGNAVCIPNGHYDATTHTVIFTTTHFSQYAVGYNKVSFTDVSGWYESYVNYLAARKIINGTGDGKFSPDANITRAEFVTILSNLSGNDLSAYTSSAFSDVSTSDWYNAAVQWAYKNGIAAGSDGKFAPGANITREQMAVMIFNYAKYVGINVSNAEGMSIREFSDYDSISNWAMTPIQWAINNSIVSGNSDGSFAPMAYATRAQAAKMIALLLQGSVK